MKTIQNDALLGSVVIAATLGIILGDCNAGSDAPPAGGSDANKPVIELAKITHENVADHFPQLVAAYSRSAAVDLINDPEPLNVRAALSTDGCTLSGGTSQVQLKQDCLQNISIGSAVNLNKNVFSPQSIFNLSVMAGSSILEPVSPIPSGDEETVSVMIEATEKVKANLSGKSYADFETSSAGYQGLVGSFGITQTTSDQHQSTQMAQNGADGVSVGVIYETKGKQRTLDTSDYNYLPFLALGPGDAIAPLDDVKGMFTVTTAEEKVCEKYFLGFICEKSKEVETTVVEYDFSNALAYLPIQVDSDSPIGYSANYASPIYSGINETDDYLNFMLYLNHLNTGFVEIKNSVYPKTEGADQDKVYAQLLALKEIIEHSRDEFYDHAGTHFVSQKALFNYAAVMGSLYDKSQGNSHEYSSIKSWSVSAYTQMYGAYASAGGGRAHGSLDGSQYGFNQENISLTGVSVPAEAYSLEDMESSVMDYLKGNASTISSPTISQLPEPPTMSPSSLQDPGTLAQASSNAAQYENQQFTAQQTKASGEAKSATEESSASEESAMEVAEALAIESRDETAGNFELDALIAEISEIDRLKGQQTALSKTGDDHLLGETIRILTDGPDFAVGSIGLDAYADYLPTLRMDTAMPKPPTNSTTMANTINLLLMLERLQTASDYVHFMAQMGIHTYWTSLDSALQAYLYGVNSGSFDACDTVGNCDVVDTIQALIDNSFASGAQLTNAAIKSALLKYFVFTDQGSSPLRGLAGDSLADFFDTLMQPYNAKLIAGAPGGYMPFAQGINEPNVSLTIAAPMAVGYNNYPFTSTLDDGSHHDFVAPYVVYDTIDLNQENLSFLSAYTQFPGNAPMLPYFVYDPASTWPNAFLWMAVYYNIPVFFAARNVASDIENNNWQWVQYLYENPKAKIQTQVPVADGNEVHVRDISYSNLDDYSPDLNFYNANYMFSNLDSSIYYYAAAESFDYAIQAVGKTVPIIKMEVFDGDLLTAPSFYVNEDKQTVFPSTVDELEDNANTGEDDYFGKNCGEIVEYNGNDSCEMAQKYWYFNWSDTSGPASAFRYKGNPYTPSPDDFFLLPITQGDYDKIYHAGTGLKISSNMSPASIATGFSKAYESIANSMVNFVNMNAHNPD